jgi:hypothetical protein
MKQVLPTPVHHKKVSLSDAHLATLNVLMDLFIPASKNGRMPAARSLNLFSDIGDMSATTRSLLESGLADLEQRAHQRHGQSLAQMEADLARALVDELRAQASPFIQNFMTQTAGRYLAHDQVVVLLGLEARPPWPIGHVVEQGDWALLDVVKKRAKIYRTV